mgnify:CR=1 FL=1
MSEVKDEVKDIVLDRMITLNNRYIKTLIILFLVDFCIIITTFILCVFQYYMIALIILFLIITFNQNIFLITSNAVYAEEIAIPILTYHNFTTEEGSSYKINIVKFEKYHVGR